MTITLRSTKGSALTYAEMDANFSEVGATNPSTISVNSSSAALTITQTGSGNAFVVEDSASPDSTPFVITSTGQVLHGSGTRYPLYISSVKYYPYHQQHAAAATSPNVGYSVTNWATTTGCGTFNFVKARGGTICTHTIVDNNDQLGIIYFFGSDGTNFIQAASIQGVVDGTPGTNDMPGRLVFSTTADGASTSTERLRIDSSGNILNKSTGGLGYGTGSGGAVTQLTSRTTGVTLNKTNGAITLVSAAGSTSWQTFTVTNSTVAATDTIIVNQKSGTDLNMIHVTAVAAGSFNITFATTGGTTTEQPVFNFAVIKAVTS